MYFRLFSRELPRKKPVASENRSVRETHVRESQDQNVFKGLEAHPLSEPCVQLHTLDCFVGSPQERNPVASENRSVRKSQRQRVARQRIAEPKNLEAHPLSNFCVRCHSLHCFVGSHPQKETQSRQKIAKKEAQLRQKIAAPESRRPKMALKLILCQNLVFSSTL